MHGSEAAGEMFCRRSPSPRWRRWWPLRLALAGLLLATAAETLRVLLGRNLHVVLAGRVYRGAQPSPDDVQTLVRRFGIKTIVNLRGCCDSFEWYLNESRATGQAGIAQEDICLSAGRLPPAHEIRRLVEVLDRADYPLYLHCRRGADRTGLAAAIVLLLQSDVGLDEALAQLGPRFGHLPVGRPASLDCFFDLYLDWLRQRGAEHQPELFRHWLLEEYRGGWMTYQVECFERLTAQPRRGEAIAYRVRLRNTGTSSWRMRPGKKAGIHLGYILRDQQNQGCTGRAGLLDAEVAPGETIDLTLVVDPVYRPGRYRLLVDMVDEYQCWFYQAGSEPLEEELDIGD
jgi:protein tyrosine phosphatase (PTP) superfamily phosphohydrolase (DUF442 family)